MDWSRDFILSEISQTEKTNTLSVHFSCSVMSNYLRPHEPQHVRPPCPSPTPGVHPNPFPLCQWCHSTISSSVVPFSPCPQSFPASGSFQMSQLFASGGQSIGVSASTSVLPMFWGMLNLRCPLAIKCCWKGSWLFLSEVLLFVQKFSKAPYPLRSHRSISDVYDFSSSGPCISPHSPILTLFSVLWNILKFS